MLDRKVLEDRMATLGLSLALLSSYVGISSSRLSPMFTGQKHFNLRFSRAFTKRLSIWKNFRSQLVRIFHSISVRSRNQGVARASSHWRSFGCGHFLNLQEKFYL